MKRSVYRIIAAPAAVMAIIICIAFYSVGVIEKNDARKTSASHINSIINKITRYDENYSSVSDTFRSEYEAKAMTISLIIAHTPKALSEDMAAEELLAAIGAEELSMCDRYGNITFSTSSYERGKKIREEFSEGASVKNYHKTIIEHTGKDLVFEVAVSRRDKEGLTVIRFRNSAVSSIINYSDVADAAQINTVYPSGICAVIDAESMEYLSHTSGTLTGSKCSVPAELFTSDKNYFQYDVSGTRSLVCYDYHNGNIIMDVLPASEVYSGRNMLLIWLCVLAAAGILSLILSIRDFNITSKSSEDDESEKKPEL